MTDKQKLIFRISLGLNVFLIIFVVWEYMQLNFLKDQVFLTDVEYKLVKLEGSITNQMNDNWTEPNLVTTELGGIVNRIGTGLSRSDQLGTLTDDETVIIYTLYNKLKQYPHDEKYSLSDLTEKDKKNFEELRGILRDEGLGLNVQVSNNMRTFMNRIEKLGEKIEHPLE